MTAARVEGPATVEALLPGLTDGAGGRRARLFGCAYLRFYWAAINHDFTREALAVAERFADGDASDQEAEEASGRAYRVERALRGGAYTRRQQGAATLAASLAGPHFDFAHSWRYYRLQDEDDRSPQCISLLRDLLGRTSTPGQPCLGRLTAEVVSLAVAAYSARAFPSGHLDWARLAVLSDALEEGGCDDADLLSHLRSPGPHVRGCWALDLVLGKA